MTQLKTHNLLSNERNPLMEPIEAKMRESFQRLKKKEIPADKNFFALSLKDFFMRITEDELELMCHNYVYNWIN